MKLLATQSPFMFDGGGVDYVRLLRDVVQLGMRLPNGRGTHRARTLARQLAVELQLLELQQHREAAEVLRSEGAP